MTGGYADSGSRDEVLAHRKQLRVAWLFPMMLRTHYWQPVFREFAQLIPNTTVFVGQWGGFAPGYEGSFNLRVVQGARPVVLKNKQQEEQYDSAFYWAPLSIIRELARCQPDVIFTTGFSAWTICALLYKLATRSKVIVLWDGNSIHWKSQISRARHMQRRLMAPFFDFVVSNMHDGAEYMRRALRIPEKKLLTHPYQVADLEILDSSPNDQAFPGTRPTFLFVGSIDPRKGWRYLLEAARLLMKQGIDRFSVVFAGAGYQQEELEARILEHGLEHVAFCVGHVPYDRMASCYREADVFVFPTMDDVWGLVLIEAMAFGKPVICSRYAGAREMVAHKENGFVVDPRDVEALAGYMRRFIADKNLIHRFGARSRELMASYTPVRAAQVLAAVALETCRTRLASTPPELRSAYPRISSSER
jgi:glycosyltransferase involved in cell wall biosynthesis